MKRWQTSLINKEQQRFGLRKLSIGVASVLLGTTVYFGLGGTVAHADSQVNTVPNNSGDEETNSNVKIPYAASTEPVQAQKSESSDINYDGNAVNSNVVNNNSNVENTNVVNNVADNKVETNDGAVVGSAVRKVTINRDQFRPVSLVQLQASAVQSSSNGGFDSSTWGTLDVSKWQGRVVSNRDVDGVTRQYYELTDYTGDLNHIIVPNEADLEAAGVNTGGHQVGIIPDITHSWFKNGNPKTIAFSKTNNKMIKALWDNWTSAFTGVYGWDENYEGKSHALSKFNGASLAVNNITIMNYMFYGNQISDLTSLANWKTDNVTDMHLMFYGNRISDLTPLANWRTDKVTNMHLMFASNQISNLTPLASWKVDNVDDLSGMFDSNRISDLTPLANWRTDKVTDMNFMFYGNQINDLTPLASWKVDNVYKLSNMFRNNQISDLTPLSNWKIHIVDDFRGMFAGNQIKLADFRKWDLNQFFPLLDDLIGSGENAIILVNSVNKKSLSTNGVISTTPNSISINSDSIDMPTLYVTDDMTTPAEELAEKLVEQARAQKIADYQKSHPTAKFSLITPDPTNHAYDVPAIMANQKYRMVFLNKVTYQFVDDDNNGVEVGNAIIVSGEDGSSQKTNLVLPEHYDLATGQSLPTSVTIPTSDTTVTIHLVHTQYNVVIKYLDLSGSQVGFQTITGKWGTVKQVGTLQIPQNYVFRQMPVPTAVAILREDTEMDLVVAPTETYRSFVTSKDADLHRAVTRIITVILPNKSTKTVVQTVNFGRNAWTNNQTHQVTYSDWQADGSQKFVAYIPDAVSGYVSDVVKSQQVLADSQNTTVSVGYTPIQQVVKHPYIDASSRVYDAIPTGYHVVVGQTASDGAMLLAKDIVIKPIAVEFVTRTVTIKLPNNRVRIIHQRVRKGTQFGKVAVPHLRGYKIVVSNNVSLGRVAAGQDINLTVTFEKL